MRGGDERGLSGARTPRARRRRPSGPRPRPREARASPGARGGRRRAPRGACGRGRTLRRRREKREISLKEKVREQARGLRDSAPREVDADVEERRGPRSGIPPARAPTAVFLRMRNEFGVAPRPARRGAAPSRLLRTLSIAAIADLDRDRGAPSRGAGSQSLSASSKRSGLVRRERHEVPRRGKEHASRPPCAAACHDGAHGRRSPARGGRRPFRREGVTFRGFRASYRDALGPRLRAGLSSSGLALELLGRRERSAPRSIRRGGSPMRQLRDRRSGARGRACGLSLLPLLALALSAGAARAGEIRGRLLVSDRADRPAGGLTVSAVPWETPGDEARRAMKGGEAPKPIASAVDRSRRLVRPGRSLPSPARRSRSA